MRKFFTLALLVLVAPAQAQIVYKCVGKGGHVEFSSWPCAPTQRTVKAVAAPPEPYRPPPPPPKPLRPRARGSVTHYYGRSASDEANAARVAQCAATRREYDRVQGDFTLNRNIQLLRDLEAQLRKYCD